MLGMGRRLESDERDFYILQSESYFPNEMLIIETSQKLMVGWKKG